MFKLNLNYYWHLWCWGYSGSCIST